MFWSDISQHNHKVAVIENNEKYTYAQLAEACSNKVAQLLKINEKSKKIWFIKADNSYFSLINYLSCLQASQAILLIAPETPEEQISTLKKLYHPAGMLVEDTVYQYEASTNVISPQLALLLSTSGTTGSAKHVALSYSNLQSNAESICSYLPIERSDRTLCTLPMYYSYGLSVINSHLLTGSTLVFTPYSAVHREFWQIMDTQQISSLAGVPHSYDMMLRLGLTRHSFPALRYMTQAGGKLDATKVKMLAEYAQQFEKQFYVMYGQTEATARMAYLSPDKVLEKPDSIGRAIPGGRFELRSQTGQLIKQPDQVGELYYHGPNVMLGYVNNAQELASVKSPDWLATGDLAYFDAEGDLYIAGRIKRIVKITGQRINLDDVENWFMSHNITAYCSGNDKTLVIGLQGDSDAGQVRNKLAKFMRLHPSAIQILKYDVLPMTTNGKKNYNKIMEDAKIKGAGRFV